MMAGLDAWGGVPVPPWIGMELDPTVLGMPFLIMGKVDGRSATQRPNYNVEGWIVDMTPQQRFDAFKNAIQSFAQLSRLDWQKDGFDFLANPDWGNPGVDQYVGHIKAWYEGRSEEHTSELQSLMRISYAVFCLKKKKNKISRTD